MGLDTTHDCWHGAYSRFTRWRIAIASAAGYPRNPDATDKSPYWSDEMEALYEANPRVLQGEWTTPPKDPLLVLFVHSDCDGRIPVALCEPLALALAALLPRMGADDLDARDLRARTADFIAGLLRAHAAGEDVEFH